MSARHKRWAKVKRIALMTTLGNKCAACGTTERLTFDCIVPQGDAHHRYDTSHRMSFYHQQHRNNNLQILCQTCNAKKA